MFLGLNWKPTKFHPYESIRPYGVILEVPFSHGDPIDKFRTRLVKSLKSQGAHLDNKIGFTIEPELKTDGVRPLYIIFWDWKMYLCPHVMRKS